VSASELASRPSGGESDCVAGLHGWAVNTDEAHGAANAPEEWIRRGIAVVSDAKWKTRFRSLNAGHMVFMWVSKRGLSAIGRVVGCFRDVTDPLDMVNPAEALELHLPVDWLVDMRDAPIQQGTLQRVGVKFKHLALDAVREADPSPGLLAFVVDRLSAAAGSADECDRRVRAIRSLSPTGSAPPAKPIGNHRPLPVSRSAMVYPRCPKVRGWTLDRADGVCECCGKSAPFADSDLIPFLESHHLVWLSQGGGDVTENTVAVCPNCHRELHHGHRRFALQQTLIQAIPEKDAAFERRLGLRGP